MFSTLEKYIPPPLLYFILITMGWYQLSNALANDQKFVMAVYSPIFRYGLPITVLALTFVELRSRRLHIAPLLRGKDGILSILAWLLVLSAAVIITEFALDIIHRYEVRKVSSTPIAPQLAPPTPSVQLRVNVISQGANVKAFCIPYSWISDNHFDLNTIEIRRIEGSPIQLSPGYYRLVAVNTENPHLFDEMDVHIDGLTRDLVNVDLKVPTEEENKAILEGMIELSGAVFKRGSNEIAKWGGDRKPEAEINLRGFYIDKFEATNAQYAGFVQTTNYSPPDYWVPDRLGYKNSGDKKPVVALSWYDALSYARFSHKRLPLEAEWERAAHADGYRIYPWGDEYSDDRYVSTRSNKDEAVRLAKPEELISILQLRDVDDSLNMKDQTSTGIVGMAGNAREWCLDLYRKSYNTEATDAVLLDYRVIRGSFSYPVSLQPALAARADFRDYGAPSKRYQSVGVRCVRSITYDWLLDAPAK